MWVLGGVRMNVLFSDYFQVMMRCSNFVDVVWLDELWGWDCEFECELFRWVRCWLLVWLLYEGCFHDWDGCLCVEWVEMKLFICLWARDVMWCGVVWCGVMCVVKRVVREARRIIEKWRDRSCIGSCVCLFVWICCLWFGGGWDETCEMWVFVGFGEAFVCVCVCVCVCVGRCFGVWVGIVWFDLIWYD